MALPHQNIPHSECMDGVRMSWNVFPSGDTDLGVNLGCLYTPLKEKQRIVLIPDDAVRCQKPHCQAILNPYCEVLYQSMRWICNFCFTHNRLPPRYAGISENSFPLELQVQSSTIEYCPRDYSRPISFMYVVDTCMDEAQLDALKESLIQSLSRLPSDALVGLVTFGEKVVAYKLKAVVETCEFTPTENAHSGLTAAQVHNALSSNRSAQRFLQRLSTCRPHLDRVIRSLERDHESCPEGKRPHRSTGFALSVAVGLLEAIGRSSDDRSCRIMLFSGGPCTRGPGKVVEDDFSNTLRSYSDINKGRANFMLNAIKHYEALAARACTRGYVIDMYACAPDQTGVLEMKSCPSKTGGILFVGDSFSSDRFKASFRQGFDMKMGYRAFTEVKTSREVKVQGFIGPGVSMKVGGANVSEREMGVGGTNKWMYGALDANATIAIFFEIVKGKEPPKGRCFIQLVTKYLHSNGQYRLRVSTLARPWVEAKNLSRIAEGFDAEAAAVLLARLSVFRLDFLKSTSHENIKWLDLILIHLFRKFGQFSKGIPSSFRITSNFSLFPAFLYYFRRSTIFCVVSNHSPDSITFYRHMLNRETTGECIRMIRPFLFSYIQGGLRKQVELDTSSVHSNAIVLMDSYFELVTYHGTNIELWMEQQNENDPRRVNFNRGIGSSLNDVEYICRNRFPCPRYIAAENNDSLARTLLAYVNPSYTHNIELSEDREIGTPVWTDLVSYQLFKEALEKLVVQKES